MEALVRQHYVRSGNPARMIAQRLRDAGLDPARITTAELAPIDEFHVRGRKATLELASRLDLGPTARVLDVGSGLGGPARTLAEVYGCHVTGIDLTPEFCEAAEEMTRWVGLADKVAFAQADGTALPFEDATFDAAMTIHVAMNIAAKDRLYAGVRRVLKPGGIFAAYDILQGEGGDVLYPVPWATEPSISHLATPARMRGLLERANFQVVEEIDSTEESTEWFREQAAGASAAARQLPSLRTFLGPDHALMARNQVRNLAERRIRTVSYICCARAMPG